MCMKPVIVILRRHLRQGWHALVLGACAILVMATSAAAEVPAVVVSIKPIHSLVAAVMAGVGVPTLIVDGNVSLHDYSLRPEDAERIAAARLVFWVGPMLETFLQKPLVDGTPRAEVIRLADAPGVELLQTRQGGGWGADAADQDWSAARPGADGHIWLDPVNARRIVAAVMAALSGADPEHAPRYTRNAVDLYHRLDGLDAAFRPKMAPLVGKPFVVFHDAYQYFERRYTLKAVGAIIAGPGQSLSPRRLQEVRHRIRVSEVRCVFGEPQVPAALMKSITAETTVRTGTLDPEGIAIEAGPDLYFTLLTGMVDELGKCLLKRD